MQTLDPDTLARIRALELRLARPSRGSSPAGIAASITASPSSSPSTASTCPATTSATSTGRSTAAPSASTSSSTSRRPTSSAGCSSTPASRCATARASRRNMIWRARPRRRSAILSCSRPTASVWRLRFAGAAIPAAGQPADAPQGRVPLSRRRRVGRKIADRSGVARRGRTLHAPRRGGDLQRPVRRAGRSAIGPAST